MITLSCPQLGLTHSVRNPEFGNQDKYEQNRIYRRTRGGNLIQYRDPIWPTTETISYSFKYLTNNEAHGLLNFIDKTLGLMILLQDYDDQWWQGLIINPEKEISQDNKEDQTPTCDTPRFSASFDFVGVML
jgi:hypothetical protein